MNSAEFDLVEIFGRRHLPGFCLHFHGRFPDTIMQELMNSIFWRPRIGRREVPHEDADRDHASARELGG